MKNLAAFIRDVPDFPKKGILFKDITPLLGDPKALAAAIKAMAAPWKGKGIDKVASVEARGFIFGTGVALALKAGFVPLRKPGKLPWKKVEERYALEYGTDAIQVHADAIRKGEKVLLVDDLLATGGTIAAAARLVRRLGGKIEGCAFLVELKFLNGRKKLGRLPVRAFIIY